MDSVGDLDWSGSDLSLDDMALVTAAEAAPLLGVDANTIHDWKRRERVTPVSRTPRGWPLYAMRELLEVEHGTRTGQGSRRRA